MVTKNPGAVLSGTVLTWVVLSNTGLLSLAFVISTRGWEKGVRGEGGRKNSDGEGKRLSEGLNCKLYQLPAPNCHCHWPDSSSPYTGQIPHAWFHFDPGCKCFYRRRVCDYPLSSVYSTQGSKYHRSYALSHALYGNRWFSEMIWASWPTLILIMVKSLSHRVVYN